MKYIFIALLFFCGCTTTKPNYEIHSTNGIIMKLNQETGETWMYYMVSDIGGAWVKINEVDVKKLIFERPIQKSNY